MSLAPAATPPQPDPPRPRPLPMPRRRRKALRWITAWGLVLATLAGAVWWTWAQIRRLAPPGAGAIPVAAVAQGTVRIEVHAQGLLNGGNAQMLVAPPVAGGPMSLKFLLPAGTLVQPGEVVAVFDTAPQQYNLVQAQEALEQARQEVIQAQATAAAQREDDAYQLVKAQFDVARARLQVRANPIRDAIDARKNTLALAAAQAHLRQLQQDIASRSAGNAAAVALQQAAVRKAQTDAATAAHAIASMTLRARQAGYVALQPNTDADMLFMGMSLPTFRTGDAVQPGQAVAQIPNTAQWQVALEVSELDAGHLAAGQPARVRLVPFPGREFHGRVQSVGAAGGPPWKRQVACVVRLTDPSPRLRPGVSAAATITTAVLRRALWVPSEAVFDFGGHSVVYVRQGGRFRQRRVRVVERSESQVVIAGLPRGAVVALANPENRPAAPRQPPSAAAAVPGGGGGR